MKRYQHLNDLIIVQDGGQKWIGTSAVFTDEYGAPPPAMPDGYRERLYQPGVRHDLKTSNSATPQDLSWSDGDTIIAAIGSLVAAQDARTEANALAVNMILAQS